MKLNNKGFAITAVLYGILILFALLVGTYLMMLSARKNRIDTIVSDIETEYNNAGTNNGVENFANLVNLNSTITAGDGTKYYVDTTNHIIKDLNNNLHYYGTNPNNYIKFNCDNYPNTNCETWRIIGIVDGKVKLMRNDSIGQYSWDSSYYTNNGNGINEWSQSVVKDLLNPDASGASASNRLYFYSGSGNCYNGASYATTSCNFTTEKPQEGKHQGIKGNTIDLIADSTWYTAGESNAEIYPNQILTYERGTKVIQNPSDGATRNTTWTGKIALPYPSEYGYATDLKLCNTTLDKYNDNNCKNNNWMYNILTNSGTSTGWLLTPYTEDSSSIWDVYADGNVRSVPNYAKNQRNIVPVLFINENIDIDTSHTGSIEDPYVLNVKDFSYTGNIQEYSIPKTGTYLLETWGAQGGNDTYGGYGGYSNGEIKLNQNDKLYVVIGGQGKYNKTYPDHNDGGYNGGGIPGINESAYYGYGGGGATHIATKSGVLSNLSNSISDILIVSGGGGGGSAGLTTIGGSGGGYIGGMGTSSSGYNTSDCLPTGGTQTGPGFALNNTSVTRQGEFGTASQNGTNGAYGGGGGGGFYGGGTGFGTTGSGGSGYIGNSSLTNKKMYCYNCTESNEVGTKTIKTTNVSDLPLTNWTKKGNGFARITYISKK